LDPDLILIIGLVTCALAIPAIVSALSDQIRPRLPALVMLIGAGCVVFSIWASPTGYAMADVPRVFFDVIGRYGP